MDAATKKKQVAFYKQDRLKTRELMQKEVDEMTEAIDKMLRKYFASPKKAHIPDPQRIINMSRALNAAAIQHSYNVHTQIGNIIDESERLSEVERNKKKVKK